MHPVDCPEWEYDNYPNKTSLLNKEIKSILLELRNGGMDAMTVVSDTRPVHHRLFWQLVPEGYPYYAGFYRGEKYRCLQFYRVMVTSDPRVGFEPHLVKGYMDELSKIVHESILALDEGMNTPHAQVPIRDKIGYVVAAVCRIFELFLRIHPYANGNGHTARFCIWALLARYGLWPVQWPIDPRPGPPYTQLITTYRNGNKAPLEMFIIQSLVSN